MNLSIAVYTLGICKLTTKRHFTEKKKMRTDYISITTAILLNSSTLRFLNTVSSICSWNIV